ncbi:cytochrome C [Pseudomonas sp. AOB-7]|uniref:c-type cytochrome n=1 Tax=Pseudomonas sp. AOB-7 TaxID=2482750 RepID=UPI000EFCCCF8|nr:c-type cytochrome [Pseudomonas sp. AOB-7]RMH86007.1 cytochrome C [Pseudomonas sp. AOB-7]
MHKIPTLAVACGLLSLPLAHADVTQLLQSNACTACHQPAARVVGPSWQEVAQRYGDGSKSAEQLAASIKSGGSGSWGAVPMPPQTQLSDADASSIAEWILTTGHQ